MMIFAAILLLPGGVIGAHPNPAPSRLASGGISTGVPRAASATIAAPPPGVRSSAPAPVYTSEAASLSVCNGTVIPGARDVICGPNTPFATLYDPLSRTVFLANAYGFGFNDFITAYDPHTFAVRYTIDTGWALDSNDPMPFAIDSADDALYIAEPYAGPTNSGAVQVVNASSGAQIAWLAVSSPISVAYDPDNQRVYVGESGSRVGVLNATRCSWVGNLSAIYTADGLYYDHATKELYASELYNASLVAYSPSSGTVAATISIGMSPEGIALDPSTGELYVADHWAGNVSVVDASTNSLVATLGGQAIRNPSMIAYDPSNGSLYVANWGSSTLTVIAGSTHTPVHNLSLGYATYPTGVAYDAAANQIVVAEQWGAVHAVYTVAPANGNAITAYSGVSLSSGAYDPAHHRLYVTDSNHCAVLPIDLPTGAVGTPISAGCLEMGAAYDPTNHELYVANYGPYAVYGGVTAIDTTTGAIVGRVAVGYYTSGLLYDARDRAVFAASYYNTTEINASNDRWVRSWNSAPGGYNGELTLDPRTDVVLVDNGWVRAINATNHTMFRTVVLPGAGVDAAAFDPATNSFYAAGAAADNVTVLNASSLVPTASINNTCYSPDGAAIDPATGELFVSCNIEDSVVEIDPATDRIVCSVVLGSSSSGTGQWPNAILAAGAPGELVTTDASGAVSILSTERSGPRSFAFLESGLPVATAWTLHWAGRSLTGSTPLLTFLGVGSDHGAASVASVPGYVTPAASVTPSPGLASSMTTIGFAPGHPTSFPVRIHLVGLADGTYWGATFGGQPVASTGRSATVLEPNGSVAYAVGPVPGYRGGPYVGAVTLHGAGSNLTFSFARVKYTAAFNESGLAAGARWVLVVGGHSFVSASSTITLALPNGTYLFTVHAKGLTASPAAGSVTVAGVGATRSIRFS